ncbi:16386_t:CDS:2, partial [Funneliformis mosseae]
RLAELLRFNVIRVGNNYDEISRTREYEIDNFSQEKFLHLIIIKSNVESNYKVYMDKLYGYVCRVQRDEMLKIPDNEEQLVLVILIAALMSRHIFNDPKVLNIM